MRQKALTKGFTLIELIIVIVLLGIMAATALPRFVDFSSDAHNANTENMVGSLEASLNLFQAKWLIAGSPPTNAALTGYGALEHNSSGWPVGSGSSTINSSDDCNLIMTTLLPGAKIIGTANGWAAVCAVDKTVYDFAAVQSGDRCDIYNVSEGVVSGTSKTAYRYSPSSATIATTTYTPTCSN